MTCVTAEGGQWPGTKLADRRRLQGCGLVVVATVLFASTPAVLVSLGNALPVLDVLFYRSVTVAAVFMAIVLLRRRPQRTSPTQAGRAIVVGALLFAPHACLFYSASTSIGTGTAVAVLFTYPAIILVARAVLRRAWPTVPAITVSVGLMIGIGMVCLSPEVLGANSIGVVMVLVAAATYAAYVLFAARLSTGIDPMELTAYVLGGAALSIGIAGYLTGSLTVPTTGPAWWAIVANSAILGISLLAYYAGLARIGTHTASTIDSTQPAVAALVGLLALGEHLGVVKAAGVALVVLCAVLGTIRRPRSSGPKASPVTVSAEGSRPTPSRRRRAPLRLTPGTSCQPGSPRDRRRRSRAECP